jgi:hypothetical protein
MLCTIYVGKACIKEGVKREEPTKALFYIAPPHWSPCDLIAESSHDGRVTASLKVNNETRFKKLVHLY